MKSISKSTMAVVTLLSIACLARASAKIANVHFERTVDLMEQGSNLITFQSTIQFLNDANENFYYYAIAKDFEKNFVALQAYVEHPKDADRAFYLNHERVESLPPALALSQNSTQNLNNVILFKIELLDEHKKAGDVHVIQVNEHHKGRREPYPKVIRVYEKQKVELYESKYALSVYETQKSTLILNVKQVDVHYTSEAPTTQEYSKITYGPFSDIEPLTFSQVQLFFTYPYPLPYFSKATRDIYVSHWGSIAVDEYFYLYNQAAGINGQFSRVDYMPHINPNHGQSAINSLGTSLPQYIHGLYYYDYIGNISSSNAERKDDHVAFNIEPRFPIFGQWKTDWNQGYQMPTHHHLFQDKARPDRHTLEIDFMHAYDKSLTEDYTVKVILPEGAHDIKVELAGDIEPNSVDVGKYFGTLDYFGRPEIAIKKTNAVHEICDSTFRVTYTFDNQKDLYLEPICMFALLFAVYLIAIIYSRIGFTLESKAAGAQVHDQQSKKSN